MKCNGFEGNLNMILELLDWLADFIVVLEEFLYYKKKRDKNRKNHFNE